ncbi:hypothetical protein SAMN05444166_1626 [Singulisphaera sp. GP187]|uniref:hypothetical protein n=1 Tax=Singulisphaera sp. GP187 TaxID=1882752 RepID=UPI000926C102|nr:hypothetical protein [Singulisphaera sp. GP187]SIN92262.1 hypothetical protein SAMN05444166_1626 [Singulisphaera sp. GP187]
MDWKINPQRLSYPAFCIAFLSSPILLAEPIETWQGAKAQVYASGTEASQQGAVAEASATGKTRIYYTSSNAQYEPDAWSVEARSTAKAEAIGTRDALLRVGVTHRNDNPGTYPLFGHSDPPAYASAEASWVGDRIHIAPGPDGVIPEHVRLGVMLELPNPWLEASGYGVGVGNIDLKLGDRLLSVGGGFRRDSPRDDISSQLVQLGFDSAERVAPDSIYFHAKAFVDLAIDHQGWSDPFDLSLKAIAATGLESNSWSYIGLGAITVSLDDLVLSDGTSVVDAGYSATFESGLDWPQPVPEPASMACWFALVSVAGWRSLKRSRTTAIDGSPMG